LLLGLKRKLQKLWRKFSQKYSRKDFCFRENLVYFS
jgi:hypothetical protein